MALIDASYTVLRDHALAGQIADTSLYNIDGACAAQGDIVVGKFVFLAPTTAATNPDGLYKVVKPTSAGEAEVPVGVATISQAFAPEFIYRDGSAVNVMTHGRVWVEVPVATTLANVAFDTPVVINADGSASFGTPAEGAFVRGHTYTGELVADKLDATKKLAKIQLLQSSKAA